MTKFMKIYKLVQKLLVGDTQMDRQTGDLISMLFILKETRLMLAHMFLKMETHFFILFT
jgi:hypothetical protein